MPTALCGDRFLQARWMTDAGAAYWPRSAEVPVQRRPIINGSGDDQRIPRCSACELGFIDQAATKAAVAEPNDASPHEPPWAGSLVCGEMISRWWTITAPDAFTGMRPHHVAVAHPGGTSSGLPSALHAYDRRHGWHDRVMSGCGYLSRSVRNGHAATPTGLRRWSPRSAASILIL